MPDGITEALETVLIYIQIVIGLGFLIFIHEAGHFLVAKWKGVRVDAFSLGMGPVLWKRLWNGTEYRISAIPLGGYVKMAGENIGDPKTGAPDELTSKSAFARLQIFAAGALMNLFIAFPLAILACLAGRSEGSPYVGNPSAADTRGGIIPGDKILEVDGQKIASTDDYRKHMIALPQGIEAKVTVERDGVPKTFDIKVQASTKHITWPPATTMPKIKTGSPVYVQGLRTGDEILKIDGQDAKAFDPNSLRNLLAEAAKRPIELVVTNPRDGERPVTLKDLPTKSPDEWIPLDFRLLEPVIADPEPKTAAAEAGLRGGDAIRKIDGFEIKSFQDIVTVLKGRGGKEVEVEVERGGKVQKLPVLIYHKSRGQGELGIAPGRSPRIVEVAEGTPFYAAGLRSGDVLLSIISLDNPAVSELAMGRAAPVEVKVRRGQEEMTFTVKGETRIRLDSEKAGFYTEKDKLGLAFNRIERKWGFSAAIAAGLKEPIDVIDITSKALRKLFVREEDPGGLAGPVGIFKASFFHAQAGLGNFLWLLVLITVNLGIFNLLPVPVLDGGHILLLAIEKVKGSPPSPRFVERFQLVGLVLLLSLLVFVTVNDLR